MPSLFYLKYTQNWENITILEQKILDVRDTSFQRKTLIKESEYLQKILPSIQLKITKDSNLSKDN